VRWLWLFSNAGLPGWVRLGHTNPMFEVRMTSESSSPQEATMTDAQIDAVIEKIKPELRKALQGITRGEAVHIFNLVDGTNSKTGVKSKVVLFVAHEAPAALLEATVRGIDELGQIYARLIQAATERRPS
jgi:hypothetical protein